MLTFSQSYEAEHEKWDVIKVAHVAMNKEEEDEREEALAEVLDPMYLLSRGDADAEGEVDDSMHMGGAGDMSGIIETNGNSVAKPPAAPSAAEVDVMDVFGKL